MHNTFDKPGIHLVEEFKEEMEYKNAKSEFMGKVVTLLIASFGLVTAFAWDETLKSFFEESFGPLDTLHQKFLYSVLITILAVGVSVALGRTYLRRTRKNLKK